MADKENKTLKASNAPSVKNEIWETVVVLFQALLIALVFRTFLFQPFFHSDGIFAIECDDR